MTRTALNAAVMRLARCRRGNIAMITALMVIPLMSIAGFAVDVSRTYIYKQRLSTALDAAALAAGSFETTNDAAGDAALKAYGRKVFNANLAGADGTVTAFDLTINHTTNVITATATADVSMSIMQVIGFRTMDVSETAEATRETSGLEVALVIDNTGSMWSNNNIASLKTATGDIIDILFGTQTTHPLLRMSIVPYSATVNIGATFSNGTQLHTSLLASLPKSFDATANSLNWKGCIRERAEPHDTTDSPPEVGGYWTQYWWPAAADNNWKASPKDVRDNYGSDNNGVHGPNIGCPPPVTPLTNVKATLVDAKNAITAWNRGGTLGNVGLAWGWRMLSPDFTPIPSSERGKSYTDPDWKKAIILMTDGNNEVYELTSTAGVNGSYSGTASDYTAYGFINDNKMGTTTNSKTQALNYMNEKMSGLCTTIKAKGITIYTIVFSNSPSEDTKTRYKACASDVVKYYVAPSQADLINAFKAIGTELSNLRLSK